MPAEPRSSSKPPGPREAGTRDEAHSPKGTPPADDRHETETAGGQHKHDQAHTTRDPAEGGERQ